MQLVNTTVRSNNYIQNGIIYDFNSPSGYYRKVYNHWHKIQRPNSEKNVKTTDFLSRSALDILSVLVQLLKDKDCVFLNSKYLAKITNRSRKHSVEVTKQLQHIFDITYHNTVTHNDKKMRYVHEFSYKQNIYVKAETSHPIGGFFHHQTPNTLYIENNTNIKDIRSNESNNLEKNVEEDIERKLIAKIKKKPILNFRKKRTNAEVKNRNYRYSPKKLADFYPLSQKNCYELQQSSGREFDLNAMNEILLDISKRLHYCVFYSRKRFMSYMTKIYKNEIRDVVKINNITFRIKANQTKEDVENIRKTRDIEKYLTSVENITEVSQEVHLRKKLVGVLKPETAYELLRNYKSISLHEGKAVIELHRHIEITDLEKDTVLSQVKATHEKLDRNGKYLPIEVLEFKTSPELLGELNLTNIDHSTIKTNTPLKTGIWGDIRNKIVELFGSDGEAIDSYWISKLSAEIDEENKQIKLKAPNASVKRFIEERYKDVMHEAVRELGFIVQDILC